jgi:hypothetical protein
MNGKQFLDGKYGKDRVNGKGLGSILDEFAKVKLEEYKESQKVKDVKKRVIPSIPKEDRVQGK